MLALGLLALVVSQSQPEAPAVCLQARTTDSIDAAHKRLLPSENQLRVLAYSNRKDIPDDSRAATVLLNTSMDLFDIMLHFSDLAVMGGLSTDKETKRRIRRRMVYILQVVRMRIDNLKEALDHYSAYVTLPVLANEVKELRSVLADLEEGMANCFVGTTLPDSLKPKE